MHFFARRQVAAPTSQSWKGKKRVEALNSEARVIEIVAQQLRVRKEKITPETNFREDLEADSIDTTSILMRIENDFNTHLTDAEWQSMRTIQDIITYVHNIE